MTVLALDWNATRIRAVLGAEGASALPVPLEPPALELPLAIALDQPAPAIGTLAVRRSRLAAHEVCDAFLPYLTEKPGQGPRWQSGRVTLDAHSACELVWRRLQPLATTAHGVVLTVPDYLRPVQAETLRKLGDRLHLPVLGSLPLALAAAMAGRLPAPVRASADDSPCWQRSVLVLDVDEHALTLGWVQTLGDRVHLVESRSCPQLGFRFWKEKLIDGLSDRFVREHRRDPRDAPLAEQHLFDQFDVLLDATREHRSLHLGVQGREWYKVLLITAADVLQLCRSLTQRTLAEAEHFFQRWPGAEWPPNVLVTHAASRLPGIVDGLRTLTPAHPSAETRLPQIKATAFDDSDFGENLLIHDDEPTIVVRVLPAEAPVVAAHGLATAFRTGLVPRGHLETIVPLPEANAFQTVGRLQKPAVKSL